MKKLLIAVLVGGILLFAWQTLSWTVLMVHGKEYKKAPNETELLATLNANFHEDGQYFLPRPADDATSAEREKAMDEIKGKPWAVVTYHKSYDINMVTNIIQGFIAALISVFFVCWILMRSRAATFGSIFVSTLLVGVVGYLYIPYSMNTWFETPGAVTNLIDTLVGWGLCGLWLGWWLPRK